MQYIPWDDPHRDCSSVWFEHPRRRQRPASNCPTTFLDHRPRLKWKTMYTMQTVNSERRRRLQVSCLSRFISTSIQAASIDPARQTGRHSFGGPGLLALHVKLERHVVGVLRLGKPPPSRKGGRQASAGKPTSLRLRRN